MVTYKIFMLALQYKEMNDSIKLWLCQQCEDSINDEVAEGAKSIIWLLRAQVYVQPVTCIASRPKSKVRQNVRSLL